MGYNLISACHKCKEYVFHMRRDESKYILDFYKAHSVCAKERLDNVVTVMDNNGNDHDEIMKYDDFEDRDRGIIVTKKRCIGKSRGDQTIGVVGHVDAGRIALTAAAHEIKGAFIRSEGKAEFIPISVPEEYHGEKEDDTVGSRSLLIKKAIELPEWLAPNRKTRRANKKKKK